MGVSETKKYLFLTYVLMNRNLNRRRKWAGTLLKWKTCISAVENVQKGIRCLLFYSYGRYAPTREQGTHHFHSLIAEFIQ